MKLYRYFKGHSKKGKWHPVLIGGEAEQQAFENPAYGFHTILAVSSESDNPEELRGNLYYQGPFYIDIDTDGDLKNSISVAKKTTKKLLAQGIPESLIDVWISGKKGFHITVPQFIFGKDEPVLNLPHVYRALAVALGLADLDMSVYSRGKGRMWRLPGRKREDNGCCKVISSVEELRTMTPKIYTDLSSTASRHNDISEPDGRKYPTLETIFRFSVQRASEEKPVVATLIDDNMRIALGEDILPPCAQDLKMGKNLREGRGFNEKSVQMMKAVRAFVPASLQKATLDEFASNAEGESYGSESARLDHVRRSFGSVASGTDYGWACRSILSVLKQAPCDSCPLSYMRYQQEDDAEEIIQRKSAITDAQNNASERLEADTETGISACEQDSAQPEPESESADELTNAANSLARQETDRRAGERRAPRAPRAPQAPAVKRHAPNMVEDSAEGLTIHECAYVFIVQGGGVRRVTNFVIRITKVYIEHIPSLSADRRVAVQAEVYVKDKYVGVVNIEEDAWNSNAAFTSAFNGIGNLTFYGKDEDIRRMKSSLLNDIEKTTINIRRVHSYGVHSSEIAGQNVFTYVEPGWSIDNYGHTNLYNLSGRMTGAPKLVHVVPLTAGEADAETTTLFRELFGINQKSSISLLLGWNMACFMKQHISTYRNEFPLVSLWGNAGSGKTQTSGVFAALHGIHYLGGTGDVASPISLGGNGASGFATWTAISESMTVPKLVEEFNVRSLGRKYEEFVEHFKKCWNQHAVKRGTIRNAKMHGAGQIDAYTTDIIMSAPTLLIGEQSIIVPALVQRSIQIQMNEDQRRGPGMEAAFNALKRHYTKFDRFAKTAYMEVIGLSVDTVRGWVEQWESKIPTSIGDRPHYSYCVCLAGLSFLQHLDAKYCLNITAEIQELIDILIEHTNQTSGEIGLLKSQSEVDRIMGEFAVMAELSSKDNGFQWLAKGQYYLREGNTLYLDAIAAFAQYTRFAVTQQQPLIIQTYAQFNQLIRHTRYCESVAAIKDGFARGRQVMKFNVAIMAERGIEISCFEES